MRQVGVWMVLGAWLVASPSALRAEPPSDAGAYAVFAIQRATIGGRARVQGDVGCLFDALALGPGTRVTGAAAAPMIVLRRRARAAGGYFCTTLDGAATCATLPNPLIASPEIVLVGAPSNVDVSAAKRTKASSPLAPGSYGRLSAGAAAEVTLAGGDYQFESIDLAARARLLCLAACTLTVRGRARVGQAGRLGAGEGVAPDTVALRIAGQGERTALDARSRAQIRGAVYAPSAEVKVGAASRVTGSLVGDTVVVGPRVRLQGPSGAA